MRHPDQAALALYAGGDLGFFAHWRVARHVAQCEQCGDEVARFQATREIATDLAEMPDIPWNHMAAEMKANIRLGLAAGECVRPNEKPVRERPVFTGIRAAVALASIITLAVTGLVLQPLQPRVGEKFDNHTVLRGIENGIEVEGSGRAFRLMNPGATDVTTSVSVESVGARYLDPDTGQVVINKVYAE